MSERHLDHTLFGPDHAADHDQEADHDAPGSSGRNRHRPPRHRRPLRRLLVLVLALAVVGGAGYAAYQVIRPVISSMTESKDYPGPGTGTVQVTVNDGDSGNVIAATLARADVVKTPKSYLDAAAQDAAAAAAIQPGAYTLRKQMAAADALAVLVNPANRSVPRVTVREGLWAPEVYAALSKGTGVPVADYQKASKDAAALGLPVSAKGNVEGYLFPSTYEFPFKASAAQQLRTMVAKAVAELTTAGVAPANMERTMILASIVEAEASRDADRPKVARVIENRLAKPMKLELDSTVSYGVQRRAVTTTNAERAARNGYNTYLNAGLPVGPINSPGASAIQAASAPAPGPWLFFVAVNPVTGETRFATTFAEHQVNVAQFQKFCQANPGTC